jgi:single-strand DNA-binding protein
VSSLRDCLDHHYYYEERSAMSNEIKLTVIGSLTADPELRYTPSGVPVANFTIASNPRVFNKPTGEWRDGDPVFMRCTVWRDPAENTANSLSKGDRIIAHGRLLQKSYETDAGEKRTSWELLVDEVGPSLRWASTKVEKVRRVNSHTTTDDTSNDEPPF